GFTVSVDLYVGGDKWSHQPRPYRSLMIGAVTLGRTARVSPTVLGIAWRKAAHVVICVGVQFLAILIKPGVFGVVMGVHVDDLRIPICFLTGNIVAALEYQDALTGRGKVICKRAAARAGSDDDHVVTIVGHDTNPPFAPQKMQRLSLSWWSLQHFTASRPLRHK